MPWDERDQRKKDQRVAVSQTQADERHRGFDLSAQDNHSKFDRPFFVVLGEGSKSANENYQQGYALIDWGN